MTIHFGEASSGHDFTVWIPLAVALLTLVGGGAAYWWQRSLDRTAALHAERRELYRAFITSVQTLRTRFVNVNWDDFDNWYFEYKRLMGELFVTAPESVVKSVISLDEPVCKIDNFRDDDGPRRFEDQSEEYKQACEEMSQKYFAVLVAMRHDSFPKDGITAAQFTSYSEYLPTKTDGSNP